MSQTEAFLYKTNYFNRPWTWIKRMLVFCFFVGLMVYFEYRDAGEIHWKYLFLLVCAIVLLLFPKDDLAIDGRYLYHFRRSIVPIFSRTKMYELKEIKVIRTAGVYSRQFEIMELLGYGFSNSIEMIFKDDSSVTLNLPIYKSDLTKIVFKAKELLQG